MNKMLFLTLFLLFGLNSCQSQSGEKAADITGNPVGQAGSTSFEDLGPVTFKAKMTEPDVVLLDVRTPEEIAQGKIEGAIEINFYDENFSAKMKGLEKDKTYLIYCRSGNRSGKACKIMSEQGFKKLYNLKGGYTAWSQH